MADNKSKQDGRDDSKIDVNDTSEIAYAAQEFGVSADQVREAIKQVGSSREKVRQHLKK